MVKVAVIGPKGKMGSLIAKEAMANPKVNLVGCVGNPNGNYIGLDAGQVTGSGTNWGVKCYGSLEEIIDDCQVVIDFTTVKLSMEILDICIKYKKPLICGTTGFAEEEEKLFGQGAKVIPLIKASNTSYMVHVMKAMAELAARFLGDTVKVDILDLHDSQKVDAPSGTAKELAKAIEGAFGSDGQKVENHSIRAGDISSTHTIYFTAMGERMELTHSCKDWTPFAKGAIKCSLYLYDKEPGEYTVETVLGI